VKYGSAGFNPMGYKAGCTFALGTYAQALADPLAAQYLCSTSDLQDYTCLFDYSGAGVCVDSATDDFVQASPVKNSNPYVLVTCHAVLVHLLLELSSTVNM
jgi:hypothetical protein